MLRFVCMCIFFMPFCQSHPHADKPHAPQSQSINHTNTHRWTQVARALPSLVALCQSHPPHALAKAAGDAQLVLTLAALSKLKLRVDGKWLQVG